MQRMKPFAMVAVFLIFAMSLAVGCGKGGKNRKESAGETQANAEPGTAAESPAAAPSEESQAERTLPQGLALEGMEVPEGGGLVCVRSFPPGGMVVINGDTVGVKTPTTVLAEAGHYEVRVGLKDFTVTPESLGVDVTKGSRDTLTFQMVGEPLAKFGLVMRQEKEVMPAWSPDGKTIAFEAYYGKNRDIYTIPVTGGEPTRITFDRKADASPCWSPDGKTIVFTSNRGGTVDLWAVSARGGEPRRLTTGGGQEQDATFSPDGKWIAFESLSNIWKIPADGGKPVQVTEGPERHFYPDWSPNGKEIAFTAAVEGGRQIWVVNVKSGKIRKIVHDTGWSYAPAWSPNGKMIAFVRRSGRPGDWNHDLWLVPSQGGNFIQLTMLPALDQYPCWSPDGREIVWTQQADIWVMTNVPAWMRGEGEREGG